MKFWKKADDRPAVFDPISQRWWSRGELDQQAATLAAALPSAKSLLFCFCRNDLPSLTWYLAALHADHAVALLDASLATEMRRSLIDRYCPDCILSSMPLDEIAGEHVEFSSGHHLWVRNNPPITLHPKLTLLLSTSGTTGSAKFVRLTSENLHSNAVSICAGLDIGEEDCAITSLPFHYSYGLSVVNTHLMSGGRLVLTNGSLMTQEFWSLFRGRGCTSFAGVPYSYQMLMRLNLDSLNIPSLCTLTQAGGKLQSELIAEFHRQMEQRGGRFFVMYGQTEATARISILPPGALPSKLGSAGLAIQGGHLSVTDESTAGELVYTGPNVMMGYASCREDLALDDELHGRLHTGDRGYFDPDGFVYITGRTKRDAKLFGLRINLDDVESMLRVHGPTAVVASGSGLRIFCEYGDFEEFQKLRNELAALLRVHHHAFSFERIRQLPLKANGKVDYQALGDLNA